MKIDRSNYEVWFIDWLDGNLNSHQAEELNLFLDKNPDLKEEFIDLTSVKLEPSGTLFKNKDSLRKFPADISMSQFEYLCVAYLEDDLSSDQKSELMEIIIQDAEKKKSFDLIQKSKLIPTEIKYNKKNSLLRRTPMQKVIRLSVIALSSAAAVTLILTTYLNAPEDISTLNRNTTLANITESTVPVESGKAVPEKLNTDTRNIQPIQKNEDNPIPSITETVPVYVSELNTANPENSEINDLRIQDINVNKININTDIGFNQIIASNTLIAANISYSIPEEDDGRSNIGRFISRTFREKFLKEDVAPDSPLKGYEIAEAGVTGINKLLGWEMALDKNSDENGEFNSVYFSSKLLKFNTPVKKSEPQP